MANLASPLDFSRHYITDLSKLSDVHVAYAVNYQLLLEDKGTHRFKWQTWADGSFAKKEAGNLNTCSGSDDPSELKKPASEVPVLHVLPGNEWCQIAGAKPVGEALLYAQLWRLRDMEQAWKASIACGVNMLELSLQVLDESFLSMFYAHLGKADLLQLLEMHAKESHDDRQCKYAATPDCLTLVDLLLCSMWKKGMLSEDIHPNLIRCARKVEDIHDERSKPNELIKVAHTTHGSARSNRYEGPTKDGETHAARPSDSEVHQGHGQRATRIKTRKPSGKGGSTSKAPAERKPRKPRKTAIAKKEGAEVGGSGSGGAPRRNPTRAGRLEGTRMVNGDSSGDGEGGASSGESEWCPIES